MNYDFAVVGNGWKRNIYYIDRGEYVSFEIPGGGSLVAQILQQHGYSVAPVEIQEPQQIEHLSLVCSKGGVFSIGEHTGFTKGNNTIEPRNAV